MSEARLLGLHQLAQAIGLPAAWIKTEAAAGRLPCLKVGRHLRFNLDAVELALLQRAAGDIDQFRDAVDKIGALRRLAGGAGRPSVPDGEEVVQ